MFKGPANKFNSQKSDVQLLKGKTNFQAREENEK